jgi:hypothetical protein
VAQCIVDARLDDPFMMQRLEFLREKADEGRLTEQERAEYEAFVEGNDLSMPIKDQARSMLQNECSAPWCYLSFCRTIFLSLSNGADRQFDVGGRQPAIRMHLGHSCIDPDERMNEIDFPGEWIQHSDRKMMRPKHGLAKTQSAPCGSLAPPGTASQAATGTFAGQTASRSTVQRSCPVARNMGCQSS